MVVLIADTAGNTPFREAHWLIQIAVFLIHGIYTYVLLNQKFLYGYLYVHLNALRAHSASECSASGVAGGAGVVT